MAARALPEGVALRHCTEAELPGIHTIYAHHVLRGTGSFEEVPPDQAEMRARWQRIAAQDLPYLVAARGAEVLGFAYAAPFHPRAAYRFTLEDSVYVAPDAARMGVGRALVAELLRITGEAGYRQMIALIGDSGNAGSIGLHTSLGFEHMGQLGAVGFKFDRWLDVVYMQRALGGGVSGRVAT